MPPSRAELAERARQARIERLLSLRAAEARTGLSRVTITAIEAGDVVPRQLTLARLAAGYGLPVDHFLVDNPPVPAAPSAARPPGSDRPAGAVATSLQDDARLTGASTAAAGHRDEGLLSPAFTFENFVVGETNKFAHAAARAAAEFPADAFNPILIYGGSGLGKTHLLHAIGNHVRRMHPSLVVQYDTTETFLHKYVQMIRASAGDRFRRHYRQVDVLLIDDIQFLAGHEQSQIEFFHTFNHLVQNKNQIVVTSDVHPRAVPALLDRLRSRFVSGLVVDVQPPDLDTRLSILRRKSPAGRTQPPPDVLELIATRVVNDVRELEGALTKLVAYSGMQDIALDVAVAEEILRDTLPSGPAARSTPALVLEEVAKELGFTVEELCGAGRTRALTEARHIAMYVLRDTMQLSYPRIGQLFGGREHTTVLRAVGSVATQMKKSRAVFDQVVALRQTVRASSGEPRPT